MSILYEWSANEWGFMCFNSIGSVADAGNLDYERSLPPPPIHIDLVWVAAILSGIGCLAIMYILVKEKVKKRSHVIVMIVILSSLLIAISVLILAMIMAYG